MPGSTDETLVADTDDAADLLSGATRLAPGPSQPHRTPPGASSPMPRGSSIGRYVVLDKLGQGGMGVVYSAYDPELDRRVALKLLRPVGKNAELAAARLLREAQAMAKLSHPHVVTVHDVGQHAGKVFVAMEFVEGETLRDWVEAGGHDSSQILELFRKAGAGLLAAHRVGLIHRDFKPENVLLGQDGRVRVADFGLARSTEDATGSTISGSRPPAKELGLSHDDLSSSVSRTGVSLSSKVTQTGAFLGTPAYMSPEQFRGSELGPATDQFSFAVALWEALFEERPFAGDSPSALAFQVLQGERREAPKGSSVPRKVRAALERALSTEAAARYPSMEELLADLEPARTSRWMLPAALAVSGLVAFGWSQGRKSAAPPPDPCAGGQAALERVWSPSAREELAASLDEVDAVWAKDTKLRSLASIDAWGERFVDAHREACEATQVRHEQSANMLDLRMLCLDRRLRRLEAIKSTLEDADEDILRRAEPMLRSLDDLEACADPERLTRRDPLPVEPEARKQVLELQSLVEQASTLRMAGRYDDAIKLIRARMAEAEVLSYRPLLSELHFELGRSLGDTQDDAQASHEELFEAFRLALESGEDAEAARAAAALISSSEALERREGADRWFEIADAIALRIGGAPGIRGALYVNRGNSLRARGLNDEALAAQTRAHEFYVESKGPRCMQAGDAIFNRSALEWDMGRYADAARDVERAVSIWREHVGDDHPRVISAQGAHAMFAMNAGKAEEAIALQQGVIEKQIELYGEDSIRVADARLNFSAIATGVGRNELAWEAVQLAKAHYEKAGKTDTIGYGQILGNGSSVALELGRPKEAENLARRTRAILTSKVGEGHAYIATAQLMIALALEAQGKLAEAKRELLQAASILELAKGAEYAGMLEVHTMMSRLERKAGNYPAARAQLAAGQSVLSAGEPAANEVGEFWLEAAQVAGAAGDDEARGQARAEARKAFEGAGSVGKKAIEAMGSD